MHFFYLKLTILDFLHNLVVKLFVTKTYWTITWVRYVSFFGQPAKPYKQLLSNFKY